MMVMMVAEHVMVCGHLLTESVVFSRSASLASLASSICCFSALSVLWREVVRNGGEIGQLISLLLLRVCYRLKDPAVML